MSNFPDEISRQQRLKRWIVAPFGQAREDKGLSWDKLIHVVLVDWVHLSLHVSECMVKPSLGFWHLRGLFYSGLRYFDVTIRVKRIPFVLNFWCLVLRHELLYNFFIYECMLTVDTVCDQNMLTGSSPGAATVVYQTGTVFVCYFTVIGQFLGIFYSYGFKAILGIRYQRFHNLKIYSRNSI